MGRFKRFVAVMLLSLTVFNSIFASYSMTVKAAEVLPVTFSALDALLSLFGLEIGLGNQSKFFQNSEFDRFITAVANGETVSVPAYGNVNFSDSNEIYKFMVWANALSLTAANNDVMTLSKMLDSTSYKNTGTSATNAMQQQINALVGDYNGSSEALAEDVRDTFTVITGGASSGGDDDNDDEENDEEADNDNVMTPKRWDLFTAVMSTFIFGASEKFNEFVDSFRTPENTEYTEYSTAFDDSQGFTPGVSLPLYSNSADPDYSNYKNYYVIGVADCKFASFFQIIYSGCQNLCFIRNDYGRLVFYQYNSEKNSFSSIYYINAMLHQDGTFYHQNQPFFDPDSSSGDFYDFVLYVPLFSDMNSAKEYFINGDTSGILNLVDDSAYPNFKKVAPSAFDTLANNVNKWMDTNPSIDDFPVAVPSILDIADTVVGTPEAVPEIDDAIADTAGVKSDPDGEPDSDENTSPGVINYMGILGKILNAILSLPKNIWKFFTDPLGVILQDWQELLQWLKDFQTWLANCWADLLAAIAGLGEPKNPWGPIDGSGGGSDSSGSGSVNLLNAALILVYILFKLLQIFLHLLEFIINIFKIPATPGFITGHFATGFEFIKTVQLSPLSISVYDFLMGLIHILVIFSVVKVLKRHIDKLHI